MLVSHMVDIYMEEFETNKQVPVFSIVEKRLNNSSLLSFTNRYGEYGQITISNSVFIFNHGFGIEMYTTKCSKQKHIISKKNTEMSIVIPLP
jgi:hypothetical protein